MEHDYKLYEEYGYKSHKVGKFKEWQAVTSSIILDNPKINRGDAAKLAYSKIVGSRNND